MGWSTRGGGGFTLDLLGQDNINLLVTNVFVAITAEISIPAKYDYFALNFGQYATDSVDSGAGEIHILDASRWRAISVAVANSERNESNSIGVFDASRRGVYDFYLGRTATGGLIIAGSAAGDIYPLTVWGVV